MHSITRFLAPFTGPLRRWLAPPQSATEGIRQVLAVTDTILLGTVGLWWGGLLLLTLFRVGDAANTLIGVGGSLLLLGVRELLRRGYTAWAIVLGFGLGWAAFTSYLYNLGTPFSVHLLGYVAIVIFVTWTGGAKAGIAAGLISAGTGYALGWAATAGLLPQHMAMPPLALSVNLAAYLGICTLLIALTRIKFIGALQLAHREVSTRRKAEADLRELNATLEQRVAARTAELSASEDRYRTLLALSPDGVFVTDNTGTLLTCNEQAAHMHGYTHSSELIGRSVAEMYVPASFAHLFQEGAAVLQSGQDVARSIEAQIQRRDGSAMEVECSIARVPWSGAPAAEAFVTSFRDITRRKQLLAELEQHRLHLEERVQARTGELQAEIVERAAAQAALRNSEANLAAAQRLARLGSWEVDLTTGEIRWSDEIYRIFRVNPADPSAIRAAMWQAVHPEDSDRIQTSITRLYATGERFDAVYRLTFPDGEVSVVHGEAETALDENGRPVHVHGIVQDITEQEQVKSALAQRLQELSTVQQLGHLVSLNRPFPEIVRIYLEQLVQFAGFERACLYLRRGPRLELAGTHSSLAGLPDLASSLAVGESLCGLAAQSGRPEYTGDIEHDPRCRTAHCYGAGLRSAAALPLHSGDSVIGVLGLGSTVADAFADRLAFLEMLADLFAGRLQNALLYDKIRERAAGLEEIVIERTRELQTERDRTQAILETVGESVVVADLDGRVLYANPATLQLTGATRDEVLGQPLWHSWSTQMYAQAWPPAQTALAASQSWRGDVIGLRRDGTTYAAALTATPLYDESGETAQSGSVWVQRDITAIKEAERLKDRFVSNVSHELRTPISVIGLSCDNLIAFADRFTADERRQTFHDIHEQAHVLSSLIEDILTLSQIDSGRARQPWSEVDLARLVCGRIS